MDCRPAWNTLLLPWSTIIVIILMLGWLKPAYAEPPCPDKCSCDWLSHRVKCSNLTLQDLPLRLPSSVRYLNLSRNRIWELQNGSSLLAYSGGVHGFTSDLEMLDLSYNSLRVISPSAFKYMNKLQHLNLRGNVLEDSQLSAISGITTLRTLDLAQNSIDVNISIDVLSSLTELHSLDLSHNTLSLFPADILHQLPNLMLLNVSHNQLHNVSFDVSNQTQCALRELDLVQNALTKFYASGLKYCVDLSHVDLSDNNLYGRVDNDWCNGMGNVTYLSLSGNTMDTIAKFSFVHCSSLQELSLSRMPNLRRVSQFAFIGLPHLHTLNMSHNPSLSFIHPHIFRDLDELVLLDLSYNVLDTVHLETFQNLSMLQSLSLSGNSWSCVCQTQWLYQWVSSQYSHQTIKDAWNIRCSSPPNLQGVPLVNLSPASFSCEPAQIVNHTEAVLIRIGDSAVLDCIVEGDPAPSITWVTSRGVVLTHHPAFLDMDRYEPHETPYHGTHPWHDTVEYMHSVPADSHFQVLNNGSLYIDYTTRHDSGPYRCIASNHLGNHSAIVYFKINSAILSKVMVTSVCMGFMTAFAFLVITISISVIRHVAFICSTKERQKRKSIREVLSSIQIYKSTQIDRLSAYKANKLDKISAFKSSRVDKIRTYKQATVASIFNHMERMREYYSGQMTKIKDNCSQQMEGLRDNYSMRVGRLKDYRSCQVERVRDNYNAKVMVIREKSSMQMEKLREQYKLQHQHLIKLMELLDIGNCMTVIEAECTRTESMIFDPNIPFDLEAQPVHGPREIDSDTGSDADYFLTASSQSESSSVAGVHVVIENELVLRPPSPHAFLDCMTLEFGRRSSSDSETMLQSQLRPKHTKCNHRKRHRSRNKSQQPKTSDQPNLTLSLSSNDCNNATTANDSLDTMNGHVVSSSVCAVHMVQGNTETTPVSAVASSERERSPPGDSMSDGYSHYESARESREQSLELSTDSTLTPTECPVVDQPRSFTGDVTVSPDSAHRTGDEDNGLCDTVRESIV